MIVAAQADKDTGAADATRRARVQVDSWWATQILSGSISPLAAIERRMSEPVPQLIDNINSIVDGRSISRITSRVAGQPGSECTERADTNTTSTLSQLPRLFDTPPLRFLNPDQESDLHISRSFRPRAQPHPPQFSRVPRVGVKVLDQR